MPSLLIENDLVNRLIYRIDNAKKNIYGSIYYAKIYRTHRKDQTAMILHSLKNAVNKKVDVKLVINRRSDKEKIITSNHQFHRISYDLGIQSKLSLPGRINHAKFWIFDEHFSIIGSHNLTLRSLRISREVSIEIADDKIAKELTDYFLEYFYNIK